jgi:hypothetical protein
VMGFLVLRAFHNWVTGTLPPEPGVILSPKGEGSAPLQFRDREWWQGASSRNNDGVAYIPIDLGAPAEPILRLWLRMTLLYTFQDLGNGL